MLAAVAQKHLLSLSDAYARALALAPARGPASISPRGVLAKSGPAPLLASRGSLRSGCSEVATERFSDQLGGGGSLGLGAVEQQATELRVQPD